MDGTWPSCAPRTTTDRLSRARPGHGQGKGRSSYQSVPGSPTAAPHPTPSPSARAPPRRRARPLLCLSGAEGPAPHRGIRRSHLPSPSWLRRPLSADGWLGWVGTWELPLLRGPSVPLRLPHQLTFDDEARVSGTWETERPGADGWGDVNTTSACKAKACVKDPYSVSYVLFISY
jgi:hypothetical protein